MEQEQIIISVKEAKHLEKALDSKKHIVFLLTGNISVLKTYVDVLKKNDSQVFLHLEKIGGLHCNREGLEFIANHIQPTGIISTKNNVIKEAKKLNLITIQRVFLIDTDALKQGIKSILETRPDAVEIMPARIPTMVKKIQAETNIPIISGGLLENKEQMLVMLGHGARAVSTGNPMLWKERIRD